jgi:hypothetical protein
MARKKAEGAKAPKECRHCSRWKEMKEKIRVAKLLQTAITKMEEKLEAEDFKPSIAEYLKLLQLDQELSQDEIKEIKVTWVEPTPASNGE